MKTLRKDDGIVEVATGDRRLVQRRSGLQLSSGNRWNGIRLERLCGGPGEFSERYLLKHVVYLHLTPPMESEWRWPGEKWKRARITTGGIHIVPARIPHAGRWYSYAENLLVEIAPELLAAVAPRQTHVELRPSLAIEDPWIAQSILALEDDVRCGSPVGPLYGETMGCALAAHLTRRYADFRKEPALCGGLSSQILSRVLQFIGENLDTNLSLQSLADLAQLDLYLFLRRFKQSVGLAPHQYLLRQRIERAKSLLGDLELPITEIALRLGFASQSHFATAFRRIAKVSPRAYRNAGA